jgi:hypothetical protein
VSDADRILRPKLLTRVVCVVVYIAAISVVAFRLPLGLPDRYRPIIVAVLAVGGAFWLADVFLKRIVLCPDRLKLISVMHRLPRSVARADIDSVTWEKGGGAALRVRSGRWIPLPNVGLSPAAVTAIIRAWLKHSDAAPEEKA